MVFKLILLLAIFFERGSSAGLPQVSDVIGKRQWLYSPEGPKYIFDISQLVEWDLSQSVCRRRGGEGLVRILGEATNDFITEHFDFKHHYWIGLYRINPDALFKWWGAETMGFSAMDSDAGGNEGKDCVAFIQSAWKPVKCDTALSSLCESKAPNPHLVIKIDDEELSGIVHDNNEGDVNVQCHLTEGFEAAHNLSLRCGSNAKRVDGLSVVSQTIQAENRIDNSECVCTAVDSKRYYQAAVKFNVHFPPELLTSQRLIIVKEGSNVTASLMVTASPAVISCLIEGIGNPADGYTCHIIDSPSGVPNTCLVMINIPNVKFDNRSANNYQVTLRNGIEPRLAFNLTAYSHSSQRILGQLETKGQDEGVFGIIMTPMLILIAVSFIACIGFITIAKLRDDPNETGVEIGRDFDPTMEADPTAISVGDEEHTVKSSPGKTEQEVVLKRFTALPQHNQHGSETNMTSSSSESDSSSGSSSTD